MTLSLSLVPGTGTFQLKKMRKRAALNPAGIAMLLVNKKITAKNNTVDESGLQSTKHF